MDVIRYNEVTLKRNLDGKGRVILPGDLRESARFAPDEPVAVTLVAYRTRSGIMRQGFLVTRQCDEEDPDPEDGQGKDLSWGHRIAKGGRKA